jgi:hypothetical protein
LSDFNETQIFLSDFNETQIFLSDFNETQIFLSDFQKILKYQISRKSSPAELFHADRQMDMTKLIVALCNYVNMPKKIIHIQK